MDKEVQFLVLPGLGGDSRMVHFQQKLPFRVISANYIDWQKNETLADYSRRFWAHLLKNGEIDRQLPLFVGGMSLGGMLAQEIAGFENLAGVILLGSMRSADELLPFLRWFGEHIAPRLPRWVYVLATPLVPIVMKKVSGISNKEVGLATKMYRGLPHHFFKRAYGALSVWKGREVECPVLQIHGAADHIIPAARLKGDATLLIGAKHLVALALPDQVNHLISDFISQTIAGRTIRCETIAGRNPPPVNP